MTAEHMADMPVMPQPKWKPPESWDLPAWRERLVADLRDPAYVRSYANLLADGKGLFHWDRSDPQGSAVAMLEDECRRLAAARMYSVSGEMTAVSVRAGANMPSWEVRRTDPPSPAGWVVFDAPIGTYVNNPTTTPFRETVPIVAASWGPTGLVTRPAKKLWVTFWSAPNYPLLTSELRRMQPRLSPSEALRLVRRTQPVMYWDDEAMLEWDACTVTTPGVYHSDSVGEHAMSGRVAEWVKTLRSAWKLLKPGGSKIAEVDTYPLSKTMRRNAQRHGFDTSDVQVVRLHRTRGRRPARRAETAEDGRRSVEVRFPVSGHPRWQPYPSRGEIELIWIDEHERGPEDAPFRVGKKFKHTVHRLDQPPKQ